MLSTMALMFGRKANNNSTELAVTHRGSYDVFYSAYSGNVVIPETVTYNDKKYSVTSIGDKAFSGCTAVTKIISRATTPPACGSQALDDINKWKCHKAHSLPIRQQSSGRSSSSFKKVKHPLALATP